MKKQLKKYGDGGLKKAWFAAGDLARNNGLALADQALGTFGMTNVIQDDQYKGVGADFYRQSANIGSQVMSKVAPMALNAALPGAGTAFNALNQVGSQFNPQANNPNTPMYPNGGMVGANAEVEKQENTLNPDGTTTQFNGPSHEQGGIPTNLDPGTFIFSDKLKDKDTGKTFADANKPFLTHKEEKILNDPKADARKKLTAEIMMKAKNKQSIDLFMKQESMKQAKIDSYTKRLGGIMKYPEGGGFVPKTWDDSEDVVVPQETGFVTKPYGYNGPDISEPMNLDGNNYFYDNSKQFKNNNPNYAQSAKDQEAANKILNSATNDQNNQINPAIGITSAALSSAGSIYDLYRSKNVPKEQYERFTPTLLDPSAALRYNDTIYSKAVKDTANASGGNASTYINSRRALTNAQSMNNAQIRTNYANQNAQIKNQAGMYNNQLSKEEVIANLLNQAQARNIRANALNNIGGNAGKYLSGNQYSNLQFNRDQMYLQIIASKYPEIMNDPALKEMFGK